MIFADETTIRLEVWKVLGESVPVEASLLASDPDEDSIHVLLDYLFERGLDASRFRFAGKDDQSRHNRILVREAVNQRVLNMGPGSLGEIWHEEAGRPRRRLATGISVRRWWLRDDDVHGRVVEATLHTYSLGEFNYALNGLAMAGGSEVTIVERGTEIRRIRVLAGVQSPRRFGGGVEFTLVGHVCEKS